MTKENVKRIHLIYGILLSIVIVIAGICFIAGCVNIYHSGEEPFSREVVAETFARIALPVYLCLALAIIGFILELVLPLEQNKTKVYKNYAMTLEHLLSRKDLAHCDDTLRLSIMTLRKKRRLHTIIRTVLLILASIVFLVYALNGNNFHQSQINASVIKAMYLMIPCLLVPFVYSIITVICNNKSMQKEIELLKQVPNSSEKEDCGSKPVAKVQFIRIAILGIGLFLLIIGFIMGGTADVLTKAINICTECIGLG